MESTPPSQSITIIGGGLVGLLCASMLSSRGFLITLLESRLDPRLTPTSSRARSINLALSNRGLEAIRSVDVGLEEKVRGMGIGMRGRMIHAKGKGKGMGNGVRKEGQDYGNYEEGEMIYSISRTELGIVLLDYLEEVHGLKKKEEKEGSEGRGRVQVIFGAKLVDMDLRKDKGVSLIYKERGDDVGSTVVEKLIECDWVIGADGAFSQTRRQMMRGIRFDYKQSYALHSYLELSIPPGPNETYSIESNYLHIWPRKEFMLIALANRDKSFTLTLFAPQPTFLKLSSELEVYKQTQLSQHSNSINPNPIIKLFREEFPDAVELMGEDNLVRDWEKNPKDGLITVECSPYHYLDKVLLIGDAAHAMVPFYGQGMNCGFEDVRVLSSLLDQFGASPTPSLSPASPLPLSSTRTPLLSLPLPSSPSPTALSLVLSSYTTLRTPSLKAIQSLAQKNYHEMSSSVLSPLYLLRLSLDRLLSSLPIPYFRPTEEDRKMGWGGKWESLYRMTTFRWGLSYEEVMRRRRWQEGVLRGVLRGLGVGVVGLGWVGWWAWRGRLLKR